VHFASGSQIGPYELLSPLGEGGMGEVYRARDTRLGREVALKVLSRSEDARSRERFLREARIASSITHANVVALFDLGEHEGHPYLVTELLEGRTLRAVVDEGPAPWRKAAALALQMAEGLGAAHEKGVVHRDLKPDNMIVTASGQLKILDFGIARTVEQGGAAGLTTDEGPAQAGAARTGQLTATDATIGTPAYMSPEQLRAERVDARSDLFSFGCVLYELLAGRRPFVASTGVDLAAAILQREPPPLPESTPQGLAQLVSRCLAKGAADRPQSAREVGDALRALLGMEALERDAPDVTRTLEQDPTPRRSEAYAQYLIAVHLFRSDDWKGAEAARSRSLAADPGYAPAWALLSEMQTERSNTADSIEGVSDGRTKALQAAEKAVSLDPDLPESLLARGSARAVHLWDWAGARADFERALVLAPGLAAAHEHLGELLYSLGQLSESAAQMSRATELDPLDWQYWSQLSKIEFARGRFVQSRAAVERADLLHPDDWDSVSQFVALAITEGRHDEALSLGRRFLDSLADASPSGYKALLSTILVATVECARGNTQAGLKALEDLPARKSAHPYGVAKLYAGCGNKDRAFEWLERAVALRHSALWELKSDPALRSLHRDPRFTAILRRVNLPLD
jgi:serine/threonine protein kinase